MVAALAALAGCTYPETAVTVRDPRAVELTASADGHPILPEGGPRAEVELHVPPYNAAFYAVRTADGGIGWACDRCGAIPSRFDAPTRTFTVYGEAAEVLDWRKSTGLLRLHTEYAYHEGKKGPTARYPLDLVTPASNVAEVHDRRVARSDGGAALVLVGGLLAGTGGGFTIAGGAGAGPPFTPIGLGLLAGSLLFFVPGFLMLFTPSTDTQLLPR